MAKALSSISDFLESVPEHVNTSIFDKLIIFSDSKGRYLEKEKDKVKCENLIIEIYPFSGKRSIPGLTDLNNKISLERQRCDLSGKKTFFLFWFFTCDISNKVGKLIFPRYQLNSELIENLDFVFQEVVRLNTDNDHIQIGLLETPPIFTQSWNQQHGDPHWVNIDDEGINSQVDSVNSQIRETNTTLGYLSPKFIADFIKTRKKQYKRLRINLNADLMIDGVHPLGLIARKWLHRIIMSVIRVD